MVKTVGAIRAVGEARTVTAVGVANSVNTMYRDAPEVGQNL